MDASILLLEIQGLPQICTACLFFLELCFELLHFCWLCRGRLLLKLSEAACLGRCLLVRLFEVAELLLVLVPLLLDPVHFYPKFLVLPVVATKVC